MELLNKLKEFIKQKTILYLISSVILMYVSRILFPQVIYMRIWGFLILLAMIFILYELIKIKKKNIMISIFFIILLNVFHFGNLFIIIINPSYKFMIYSFVLNYPNKSSVDCAIIFSYLSVIFIYVGILLFHQRKKEIFLPFKLFIFSKKELKIFSYLIIIFSFPIQLYYDINRLIIALNSNYLETYNFSLSGILVQIASFYIIGFILLMVANKNNKKSVYIYLFIIGYQIINMLSGNRARQVLNMLIVSIIFFFYLKKDFIKTLSIKRCLLIVLIVFLIMNCIINISHYRMDIGNDPLGFIMSCLIPNKNIVFRVLDEFGYTLFTLVLEFDKITHFSWGLTYLGSFMTIFPTLFSFQRDVLNFSNFTLSLNYGGIGGTLIGELYYNFCWFGPFFGALIGYLVGYISTLFNNSFEKNNYILLAMIIMPTIAILWWIRDSFLNIPRMVVYQFIFLVTIYWMSKFILKNGDKK